MDGGEAGGELSLPHRLAPKERAMGGRSSPSRHPTSQPRAFTRLFSLPRPYLSNASSEDPYWLGLVSDNPSRNHLLCTMHCSYLAPGKGTVCPMRAGAAPPLLLCPQSPARPHSWTEEQDLAQLGLAFPEAHPEFSAAGLSLPLSPPAPGGCSLPPTPVFAQLPWDLHSTSTPPTVKVSGPASLES